MGMTGMADGPPERTFAGGLWSAAGSAIWPLARLELRSGGIQVSGSTWGLRWLVPAWQARYGELTSAQLIWAPIANRGVYLQTATEAGPVVFWTRRGAAILDHLQTRGVPTDHTLTRLPWGANTYHP